MSSNNQLCLPAPTKRIDSQVAPTSKTTSNRSNDIIWRVPRINLHWLDWVIQVHAAASTLSTWAWWRFRCYIHIRHTCAWNPHGLGVSSAIAINPDTQIIKKDEGCRDTEEENCNTDVTPGSGKHWDNARVRRFQLQGWPRTDKESNGSCIASPFWSAFDCSEICVGGKLEVQKLVVSSFTFLGQVGLGCLFPFWETYLFHSTWMKSMVRACQTTVRLEKRLLVLYTLLPCWYSTFSPPTPSIGSPHPTTFLFQNCQFWKCSLMAISAMSLKSQHCGLGM